LELRTIRLALEGLAAETAAGLAKAADVERLSSIQRRFDKARIGGDSKMAMILNREFHFGVYRLSAMEMLLRQIENLWVSMGPILKIYHEQVVTNYDASEHTRVIERLASRDGPGARAAIERDLLRGGEGIIRHLSALEHDAPAAIVRGALPRGGGGNERRKGVASPSPQSIGGRRGRDTNLTYRSG
jgi:DNA-binding GntR family transcriptional regulator